MKLAAALIFVAACGGRADDVCTKLVDHLAEVTGARANQRDDAIATCRAHPPPARQIDCAMAATTADAVRRCVAPAAVKK